MIVQRLILAFVAVWIRTDFAIIRVHSNKQWIHICKFQMLTQLVKNECSVYWKHFWIQIVIEMLMLSKLIKRNVEKWFDEFWFSFFEHLVINILFEVIYEIGLNVLLRKKYLIANMNEWLQKPTVPYKTKIAWTTLRQHFSNDNTSINPELLQREVKFCKWLFITC